MESKKNDINNSKIEKKLWTVIVLLILLLVGAGLIVASVFLQQKQPLSTILRDIGFVFFPVAALALLYNNFAEKHMINHIAETIWRRINEKVGCEYCQKELINIYPSRNSIDFDDFFSKATEKIWILTTNLSYFQRYLSLLVDKAKQGVEVLVLTLNPDHPFLKNRYKELGFEKCRHFFDQMVTSLRDFCNTKKKEFPPTNDERFIIKIYDNSPTLMMFRSDERIIIGFILRHGRAREHMHIEFNSSTQFSNNKKHCANFLKHFEMIWNGEDGKEKESKNIILEDIDNIKFKNDN